MGASVHEIAMKMIAATIREHLKTVSQNYQVVERLMPWGKAAGISPADLDQLVQHVALESAWKPTPLSLKAPRAPRRSRVLLS